MEINENNLTVEVDIDKEMREAYIQYSMSVIVGRALPDVRDGLKPVHRRILYAMQDLGNYHDKPYKKSARVVGDVIGKYHPHGDVAAYDSMVRMAQDFSLRYPLIDGQGNFGSIDGDSPAAQRYTEVRMTQLAEQLLNDIDKDTVGFIPNYDDSLLVPVVLPAKFPNLLVNGSSGIAVGMATNIPPHNLVEVINACIEVIQNPNCSIERLIELVPGPDFPTSGIISGRGGIISAYKIGRGIINIKAVAEIVSRRDREEILITEIPYQVNKAKLIENIADLVKDKKIEGVSDIRDESSREGMQIVITIKRGENAGIILNRLYKFTQMQISYGIILLALDNNQPRTFNLKSMLQAFINHRKSVVTRRCIFELKKAEDRMHLLEGLKKAIEQIDAIIAVIKQATQADVAKSYLINQFLFTDRQAQAILEMRLQRLTGLEQKKINDEIQSISSQISWLKKVLSDSKEIYKIVIKELEEIKEKFGDSRKTKIEGSSSDLDDEDLIASEDMIITFTGTGYIKRIPLKQYRSQKRGGKGLKGIETHEEDEVSSVFTADTKSTLLVFTDKGKLHWVKVHKLPLGNRVAKGKAIANVVNLSKNEIVKVILPVENFSPDSFIVMVTKKGIIKKTALEQFSKPRAQGVIALTIELEDELLDVKISNGEDDLFIATRQGMSIRFSESDVRSMGRSARGVKAITLGKDDFVVGLEVFHKDVSSKQTVLIITENGYGKRTYIDEYRSQSRGGVGIITQKTADRVGNVVAVKSVTDDDGILVTTQKGQVIRMKCSEISIFGRNTQGVRIMNIQQDLLSSMALVNDNESDVDGNESNIEYIEPNIVRENEILTESETNKDASSKEDCEENK